jgi:hypothetical protein
MISLSVSSSQALALLALIPQGHWQTQQIGPDLVQMTTTRAAWRGALDDINSLAGCVAEVVDAEGRAA